MESNFYFEKLKKNYIRVPESIFIAISFISSGYMSYRYLLNQEVYEEINGHFNSPKRYQNNSLKNFHLKEAGLRTIIGTFLFSSNFFKKTKKNILKIILVRIILKSILLWLS